MHGSQDSYDQTPVETWAIDDAWQEWLESNEPPNVTVPWVLDIEPLAQSSRPRVTAMTNTECLISGCSCASEKARVALHMTSSTARYFTCAKCNAVRTETVFFAVKLMANKSSTTEVMFNSHAGTGRNELC